ncbi:MAG: DUF6115 domain-containing protein [Lachnospiraceae bacterium]|nr:DUF6115 domain-containing protein [Lachnospiraceae bacterium]
MGIMEIVLIVLGVIVFVGSFLLPAGKKSDEDEKALSEEIIHEMVEKEVEGAKTQIGDIVDETITYAMEKTERSMDRLTNEKMSAVNEYSDTVLEEINKNHKEVVFLYDMLNDKHENLKSVVSEAAKMAGEVKQTVKDAEILAKEVESSVAKEAEAVPEALPLEIKAPIPQSAAPEKEFIPIQAQKVEILYPEYDSGQGVPVFEDAVETAPAGQPKAAEPILATVKPPVQAKEAESRGINPAPEPAPDVEVTLNADEKRNNNDRILEMHNAGRSNMAIAKELGLGIGEVKLVIDLFEGL